MSGNYGVLNLIIKNPSEHETFQSFLLLVTFVVALCASAAPPGEALASPPDMEKISNYENIPSPGIVCADRLYDRDGDIPVFLQDSSNCQVSCNIAKARGTDWGEWLTNYYYGSFLRYATGSPQSARYTEGSMTFFMSWI